MDGASPRLRSARVDFRNDLYLILKAKIHAGGWDVSHITSLDCAATSYFSLQRRVVSPRARTVLKSSTFQCPPEVATGLAVLEKSIVLGHDINGHQSRSIAKPSYQDGLMNDWGIHHFHLGEAKDASGFVTRTGPVLLARVDDNAVYMLAIRSHGLGHKPWFEQELVRIIHTNWPGTIARYSLSGVLGIRPVPTDSDVEDLRKAGITTMLQMPDGTVYMPLGGGQSTAGTSTADRMAANRILRTAHACQEHVSDKIDAIRACAAEAGFVLQERPTLRLRELTDSYVLVGDDRSLPRPKYSR